MQPTNTSSPVVQSIVITEPDANITSTTTGASFLVNSTGHVTITSTGGGRIIYVLIPKVNASLTITFFNESIDLIDLSAFVGLIEFSQLTLKEGSVIILLPSAQIIHILNLHPSDMRPHNFIFWSPSDVKEVSKTVVTLSIVAGAFIALGGLIVILCLSYRIHRYVKQSKVLVKVEDYFLMTIDTSTEEEPLSFDLHDIERNGLQSSEHHCGSVSMNF